MNKPRYTLKTSLPVYDVFRQVFLHGPVEVNQVAKKTEKSIQSASDQLRVLRDAKLVVKEEKGREAFYSINSKLVYKKIFGFQNPKELMAEKETGALVHQMIVNSKTVGELISQAQLMAMILRAQRIENKNKELKKKVKELEKSK